MDYNDRVKMLRDLSDKELDLSDRYHKARTKAGKAESDLDIHLTANLKSIREKKPNCGYDMAKLMLCETNVIAQELHRTAKEEKHNYKGLEKLIEAYKSRVMLEMSIMRYTREGERNGC